MFFTSPLISHYWYFFTRQLICFFHLALIFFFASKSCGFQSDCLRCCLSDGLRCFAFRWLRGKARCCVLQKTLVELESKRGIGNRTKLESLLESGIGNRSNLETKAESGIGVPTCTWNRCPIFDLVSKPAFGPGSGFKELCVIPINELS